MTFFMVELTVSDFAHSVAWYRDVLGLTVTRLDEPNGFALLETDGGRVALLGRCREPSGTGFGAARLAAPTSVRLHFHVPDLTVELARLAAVGVHPESDLKTSDEGYRRAVLRDPDGYAVTLFEWVESV